MNKSQKEERTWEYWSKIICYPKKHINNIIRNLKAIDKDWMAFHYMDKDDVMIGCEELCSNSVTLT